MAETNPATVFVAENPRIAEAVIQLLAAGNIEAEATTAGPRAETDAVTGLTEVVGPDEYEIRVLDPAKVEEARTLLASAASAAAVAAIRQKRASRTGTVTATCEECGKSSEWPASAMGTTDFCPYCQAYMDIPDPDDDWSDVDFGEPEEESETEAEEQ
jgi:hypothetical protein